MGASAVLSYIVRGWTSESVANYSIEDVWELLYRLNYTENGAGMLETVRELVPLKKAE